MPVLQSLLFIKVQHLSLRLSATLALTARPFYSCHIASPPFFGMLRILLRSVMLSAFLPKEGLALNTIAPRWYHFATLVYRARVLRPGPAFYQRRRTLVTIMHRHRRRVSLADTIPTASSSRRLW